MPLSPVSTYVHASFAKFTCSRVCFVLLCIWCLQINLIGLDWIGRLLTHTHMQTFTNRDTVLLQAAGARRFFNYLVPFASSL